jgi:hypothetical protein
MRGKVKLSAKAMFVGKEKDNAPISLDKLKSLDIN